MCACAVLVHLFDTSKFQCLDAGLAFVVGHRDSTRIAFPVPDKVSFSTRNRSSISGRGPPADAFCWDLRVWRSLLAARSNRGFCGEGPHGVGARSFRDCCQSGTRSGSSETRWLESKLSFYLFSYWSIPENVLVTGCVFLWGKFIWCSELWIAQCDLLQWVSLCCH